MAPSQAHIPVDHRLQQYGVSRRSLVIEVFAVASMDTWTDRHRIGSAQRTDCTYCLRTFAHLVVDNPDLGLDARHHPSGQRRSGSVGTGCLEAACHHVA